MGRKRTVCNLPADAFSGAHCVFLVSFPYSFRIGGYGHNLELAASCSQEKSIWLHPIHDALSVASSWRNEPLSSLQSDDKTPSSALMVEEPQEPPSGLLTIQSLSELEKQSEQIGRAHV